MFCFLIVPRKKIKKKNMNNFMQFVVDFADK